MDVVTLFWTPVVTHLRLPAAVSVPLSDWPKIIVLPVVEVPAGEGLKRQLPPLRRVYADL